MDNSEKLSKSSKATKKSSGKGAKILAVAITLLVIVAFFIYVSGVLPQNVAGMQLITTEDEKDKVVENFAVVDLNFYYKQQEQQMSMYGNQQKTDKELDEVDENTGKSQRDTMYDMAAEAMRSDYYANKWGEENLPAEVVKDLKEVAKHFSALEVESLKDMIKSQSGGRESNVASALRRMYGTGMTTRRYRNLLERARLAIIYQNYAKQFMWCSNDEEMQSELKKEQYKYYKADVDVYCFTGAKEGDDQSNDGDSVTDALNSIAPIVDSSTDEDKDEEETKVDLTEAQKKADNVVNGTTDRATFRTALLAELDPNKDMTIIDSLNKDDGSSNMIERKSFTYKQATDMANEDMAEFIFKDEDSMGKAKSFKTDDKVCVVFVNERHLEEKPTVAYRALVLNNPCVSKFNINGKTKQYSESQIEKEADKLYDKAKELVSNVSDEAEFASIVGKNSDVQSDIISGGLTEDQTIEAYQNKEEEENTDDKETEEDIGEIKDINDPTSGYNDANSKVPEEKVKLGEWLFDSERKPGDIDIVKSEDNSKITVYYFCGNVPSWINDAKKEIVAEKYQEMNDSYIPKDVGTNVFYARIKRLTYGRGDQG